MAQSNRSSRGTRRERRSSDDEIQSISFSEYHGSYPEAQTYSQNVLNALPHYPQIVNQTHGQSYPRSSSYCLDTGGPAYYPATGPTSDLGGINDYATSIASSRPSGPTSDIWDEQSKWTGSSPASTAPSRHNRNNVESHINSQRATTQIYELPCEFQGCGVVYHGDEEVEWIRHTEDHLGGIFPSKLRCCKKAPSPHGEISRNHEC